MGGVHEIFRAHSVGVAETQSLHEAHGAPVGPLHPLNPAPGRLLVVRNCVALNTLNQVGSLGFRQVRPRQQMQRGILGKLLTQSWNYVALLQRLRGMENAPQGSH